MKKLLLLIHISLLSFLLNLFIGFPLYASSTASIGVSPSQIVNNLLVPGAEYETTLVVSRASSSDEVKAKVELFGDESKSWITFPQGDTIVLAKGQNRANMKVSVKVPTTAKLAKYSDSLRFTLESTEKGQINIVPGVRVDINLQVTESKVENLKVLYIKMIDTAVSSPYNVLVQVDNLGNVSTGPDVVLLTIQDITGKSLRELSATVSDTVPPFQTQELKILVNDSNPLPIGEYWGVITVKKGGKTLSSEKVTFRVIEAIPVTQAPNEQTTNKSSSSLLLMLAVLIVILVAGAVIMLIIVFKKRNEDQTVPTS